MAKITRHKWLMRGLASLTITAMVLSTLLLFPFGAGALTASMARTGDGALGGDQYLLGEWVTLTGQVVLNDGEVQNLDSVLLQIDGPDPVDDIGDMGLPVEEGTHSLLGGRLLVTVTYNNVTAVQSAYGYGYGYYEVTGGTGGGTIDYVIQWRAPYLLQNPDAELPDVDLAWEIPDTPGIDANKLPLGMTSDGTYLYLLVEGALNGNDVIIKTDFNGNRLGYYDAPSNQCQSIAYLDGSLYVYADDYRRQYEQTEQPEFDGQGQGTNLRYRLPTVNNNWDWVVVDGTLTVTADGQPVQYVGLDHQNGTFEVEVTPAWDDGNVDGPSVVKVGSTFHMWYNRSQSPEQIGHATSTDGINWNKDASNPVFGPGAQGAFDADGALNPSVLHDGSTYHMWYIGHDGGAASVGYATSPDGSVWTRQNGGAAVLSPGGAGDWDGGSINSVTVIAGSSYELWYSATAQGDTTNRIGYAYNASGDGVTWAKLSRTTEEYLSLGADPVWSPDGTRLAHIYNGDMWLYDTAGPTTTNLTGGFTYSETQQNRYENDDPYDATPGDGGFDYTGSWEHQRWGYPNQSGPASGPWDNWQYTGVTATATFTGTDVNLRYYKDNSGGIWDVTLDGGPVAPIDAYALGTIEADYTLSGLANIEHTLVLTQNATPGTNGGHSIALDYIEVEGPVNYNGPSLEIEPAYHPTDDDIIAFVSDITGDDQIFEVDISGGVGSPVFSRVTNDAEDSYQPTYNPDGSKIAYSAKREGDGSKAIWGIGRAGGGGWVQPWRITEPWWGSTSDTYPAWSPNGEIILYIDGGDINYINVDVDGQRDGNNQNITWDAPSESHPSWSPDGTQIAYHATGGDKNIWIMDWDSNNPNNSQNSARELTDSGSSIVDAQPVWDPAGNWIYYTSDANATGIYDIWRTEDAPENPVLSPSNPGDQWSWDYNGVSQPTVVNDGQGTYHMWYRGLNNSNWDAHKIGYATSPDGKSWNANGNSVLDPMHHNHPDPNWENSGVLAPTVIDDGGYKMWYTGLNDQGTMAIGRATYSSFGGNWSRDPGTPVLEGGEQLGTLSATYNYYQQQWGQNAIIEVDMAGAYQDHFDSPNGNNLGGLGSDGTFLYGRSANDDRMYRVPPGNPQGWSDMWIGGQGNHWGGGSAVVYRTADDSMYYANGGMIFELEQDEFNQNNLNQRDDYNTGLANINGLAMLGDTMYIAAHNVGQVYTTGIPGTVKLDTAGDYTALLNVNNGAATSTPQAFSLNALADPVDVVITTPGDGDAFYTPIIDIEGTVNDPSIDTVQVGIELPRIDFLSDDMENGDSDTGTGEFSKGDYGSAIGTGWAWNGYDEVNLWHLSDRHASSGMYSWGYYNEGGWGYNTGSKANAGSIVSEPFNIGDETVLTFQTSWDTDSWVEVDRKLIDINVGSGWEPLAYIVDGPWYHDPYQGNRVRLEVPMAWKWDDWNDQFGGPQWTWHECQIDLTQLGYQNVNGAQIRFRFDTMDDFFNEPEGWFVDDVMVSGSGFLGFDVAVDPDTLEWATQYELAEGQNVVSVAAQSAYVIGDTGRDLESVTVSLDTSVPIVNLNPYPSTSEGLVTITGSVNELNFDRMEIRREGALISEITEIPEGQQAPMWDFSVDVPLVDGNNEITAHIWDVPKAAEVTAPGSDTINVIRDAGAPTIEVLDTVYYLGEVSARRGDLFVFQVNVTDQGTIPSGVQGVEVGFPGGGNGGGVSEWNHMIPASQLPEAFRDAWGTSGEYLLPMIIPDDASPGDYEMECRATDHAGNTGYADENLLGVVVSTLSAYNIYLMPNWNFFSLPLIPDDASIDNLMGDIDGLNSVQYYDAASQTWQVYTPDGNPLNDDLLILETGKGYWAEMDETYWSDNGSTPYRMSAPFWSGSPQTPAPVKFSYTGEVLEPGTVPPAYDVYQGWNAVGLHSEWDKPVGTYLLPVSVPQQSWAALLQYDNYISVDVAKMFPDDQNGGQQQEDGGSPYEIFLGSFRTLLETDDMSPAAGFWLYLTQAGKLVAMP